MGQSCEDGTFIIVLELVYNFRHVGFLQLRSFGRLPEARPEACLLMLESATVAEGFGRLTKAYSGASDKHCFILHPEGSGRAEEA